MDNSAPSTREENHIKITSKISKNVPKIVHVEKPYSGGFGLPLCVRISYPSAVPVLDIPTEILKETSP